MAASLDPYVLITEHADQLLRLIVGDIRGERAEAWIAAVGAQLQGLEDAIQAAITDRDIGVASGDALALWGDIAGESQGALSSGQFRNFILARMQVYVSQGAPDEILGTMSQLFQDALVYQNLHPLRDAGYYHSAVLNPYPGEDTLSRAGLLLGDMTPAGYAGVTAVGPVAHFGFVGNDNAAGFDVGSFGQLIAGGTMV